MCYSARIEADYRSYRRLYGADLSLQDFVDIFWWRRQGGKVKIPKAMELGFLHPESEHERQIKLLTDEWAAQQAPQYQQELFKQRKRLADAERSLQSKTTKKALDDQRIATAKIEQLKGWLADLERTELDEERGDAQIFPGMVAPVIIMENGRRVVKPMRYQCRLAGRPVNYDTRFPGTYNARRDNLEGFWRDLFGYSHGIMVINSFFENVAGPAGNVVLEFRPRPTQHMLVACLWSRWSSPGEPDLLSFAAITDEPPPEIAAAGHDRCVVPIKPENMDAWLSPDPKNLAASYAILDDRARPFYEHRLAA